MKYLKSTLFTIMTALIGFSTLNAQTVSDFENLSLPADSYYNGSDLAGSFISGNAHFYSVYDTSWGGYWASGFAYSSMRDSSDGSYLNMYSARPAEGAESSSTYAIGQQGSILTLTGAAAGKAVEGAYFTNGTYGDYSMENGDAFAKKFGGVTGNDPDWFKVTVKAWYNGVLGTDSVDVFLADFRFTENTQDYILKDWQWVSLMSLGNVDSLQFSLFSSDTGAMGMNTPPFFFFDNFTTADSPYGMAEQSGLEMNLYPNPADDNITISFPENTGEMTLELFDINGRILNTFQLLKGTESIDLTNFEDGLYFVRAISSKGTTVSPFIKQTR